MSGTLYVDSEACCNYAYGDSDDTYFLHLEDPGCLQRICIKLDYYDSEKRDIVWYSSYLRHLNVEEYESETGKSWWESTEEEAAEIQEKSYVRFEYSITSNGYAVYERVAESGE